MNTSSPRKRPKSPSIRLIEENAPWVLTSKAVGESGLTELLIRNTGIRLRKFGTADYINPGKLNAWILADGNEEPQS